MPRNKLGVFMGTTEVPMERTVGEITSELVRAGAIQVSQSYEGGRIVGLRWTLLVSGLQAHFSMPARIGPIFDKIQATYITDGPRAKNAAADKISAERIAWRQLLRWIQAQNAMIDTGMVRPMEVFVAYWIPPGQEAGQERTLFEGIIENQFKQLGPGKPV